ncbi:tetratricopeptide repeat protein [Noviherbaspirillum massiliense]|uniref:tetratricopeptide repeat protein n=1 Tax=Noviherbaspirillum massiliense TaxID=1465823 RepID=UPI0002FA662F|nr:tetratricopeptide repeat protein [Noviherbaspirillum massiliense]
MSLINQMLQDLEARRSDAPETNAFGQQVRAVPERHGIHAAWWLVLLLAVLLIAVLAWSFLRPSQSVPVAAPAPVAVAQLAPKPQLPLRLDTDMNAAPASLAQDAAAQESQEVTAPAAPAVAAAEPIKVNLEPVTMPSARNAHLTEVSQTRMQTTDVASQVTEAKPVQPARQLIAGTALMPASRPANPAPAVTVNKQIKELTPQQRAENEYRKATVLIQQGRASEAIASLEQALQLDPLHSAARQALVAVLLQDNRADDALRKAREGLALDPAQPGLAMILSRLQLERGELKFAIETLQRTLPHAAERADYQAFLAALLQRDGRHKDAVEHYLKALRTEPQSGVWWMGLGISLQAENRTLEAQEAYNRAKATNNLSPELVQFVDAKLKQLQR